MDLPYHVLKVCGDVVFAARGSNIYSFNASLEYVSAWEYPVKQAKVQDDLKSESKASPAPEGPPAKRRRVEPAQEPAPDGNGNGPAEGANTPENKIRRRGKQYNKGLSDLPFIQGLYPTTDGRHVVAVTGSDKTLWVFEHDGAGNLKQLSQRPMPKRPCDIVITPDNKTILSADKFGDVFALPLIESEAEKSGETTPAQISRSSTPLTSQSYKPQANEFTVHTLRNRKALENQKLILEARANDEKAEGPKFEHTLLLGHVSMLTAITVGIHENRQYIITADRDEHIRISRSMPQAHIIEGFCLGHDEFVSTICIPPTRPELLISGGGDDDLYVWDWASCKLLSKANLLGEVQKHYTGTDKVAVTRIFTCRPRQQNASQAKALVFVICERIPAVFCFQLKDSETTLQHIQTIPMPDGANLLDVEYLDSSPPRLLLAVDPNSYTATNENETTTSSQSLRVFTLEQQGQQEANSWQLTNQVVSAPEVAIQDGEKEKPITSEDLQKIIYTTETLRKTATDYDF